MFQTSDLIALRAYRLIVINECYKTTGHHDHFLSSLHDGTIQYNANPTIIELLPYSPHLFLPIHINCNTADTYSLTCHIYRNCFWMDACVRVRACVCVRVCVWVGLTCCRSLSLCSPFAYVDPLHCNMAYLYLELLKDSLNEYAYAAELAGLNYDLQNTIYGMFVNIPALFRHFS